MRFEIGAAFQRHAAHLQRGGIDRGQQRREVDAAARGSEARYAQMG